MAMVAIFYIASYIRASIHELSPITRAYIADLTPDGDDRNPEEDLADHPVDGGDNDDNESFDDDDDDDDVVKDTEAFETDESASTPPTSPHHIIMFSKTKSRTETMTTINQGMSVEEIEWVVAQRVANAIEAIAIYKTKTNMARKSMSQTERQEDKVAENTSNKRKCTPAERQAENKRKLDNTSKNNQNQQQPNKRQNTSRAYIAGHGEKKHYGGSKPSSINANTANNQRGIEASHKATNQRTLTCYECGNQGHYRSDCPELKNRNHGNQAEGTEARGMVYALEGGDTDQDLNNIEDEIEA
ncbi:retrotransposon protein, putative, ty3-gypsy subclass [Tanacetum coccineum]